MFSRPFIICFCLKQNFLFQSSLVLDYLCHSCYTRTAIAFARDSAVRHLDADGDEIIEAVDPEDPSNSISSSTEQFENHIKQVALRQGTYYSSVRMHNKRRQLVFFRDTIPDIIWSGRRRDSSFAKTLSFSVA